QTMNDLWPLISAKLPHTSSARVWVTGHSLGGAMATLAALRLATEGLDVRGVYTFGSPRVGNDEFYAKYSVPHYRLVNNNDVVPHVPLETTLVGLRLFTYKHVGTLEYLDRNGLLGGGMSNWDVKKAFMIDALLRAGGPWPEAAADHFIRNYIAAIEANF
ncbi:MAG TPA: lipase family protein, partial [Tepidisphaeraceae bacterium]|nr:lipase family protein [Tepidisphaeraceae bacterium]